MIVPSYWAEARTTARVKGRDITLRRFGWSDSSAADAQAQAQLRVTEAAQRAASGDTVPRRERKLAYNGADGVPIREEVLARHGEAVITRNAYGARCLNVPDLLIADVDFETKPGFRLFVAGAIITLALLGYVVAKYSVWPALLAGLVVIPVGTTLLASMLFRLKRFRRSPADSARHQIRAVVARLPDWRVRLYETPAGLRLIATHARFDPAAPAAQDFFQAIGADPLYARMCQNQRCFRARLTAKPWRIGIAGRLKPSPGVWPINPERLPAREAWVRQYEQQAEAYAACRYVETLGDGADDAGLLTLVELHDTEARALDNQRPMA